MTDTTPRPPLDLPALMDRCHAGAKAKGFWPEGNPPNPGQQLMLAIGELAEAQEADRKNRRANLPAYELAIDQRIATWIHPNPPPRTEVCAPLFEGFIKDSVEDELADCYIRLLDFAVGFGKADFVVRLYKGQPHSSLPENFGAALLRLTGHIRDTMPGTSPSGSIHSDQLAEALRGIEELATRMGIDLFRHIDLKLAYNSLRGFKHGKAY